MDFLGKINETATIFNENLKKPNEISKKPNEFQFGGKKFFKGFKEFEEIKEKGRLGGAKKNVKKAFPANPRKKFKFFKRGYSGLRDRKLDLKDLF